MIFEITEVENVKLIRCNNLNNNEFMNIIEIRLQMSKLMKVYNSTTNEVAKNDLINTFSLYEKMTKFLI